MTLAIFVILGWWIVVPVSYNLGRNAVYREWDAARAERDRLESAAKRFYL
jgi:hypothetical protein